MKQSSRGAEAARSRGSRTAVAIGCLCAGMVAAAAPAMVHAATPAQAAAEAVDHDIPAGPLSTAINRFVAATGVLVSADGALTQGRRSRGVQGRWAARDALARLLAGTGLEAVMVDGAFVIRTAPAAAPAGADAATLPAISVHAAREPGAGDLPRPFAGGQVAQGSRLGILGNVDVFETPFSTQSFTEQFVREQQSRRVADVIAVDPSVRSAQAEYGDTETYIVRGMPLFVNQVGVNGLYGMTEARRITPEFYERIDVLKGPASMLTGMSPFGVVGGNINLVSKRADDVPLTRLTTSYVSGSQFGGHLDLGRRFGEDNAWGVRVNVLARDGDTPIDRQQDRMKNGALALDYRGSKFNASLDLARQDRLTKGQTANMVYDQGFALPRPPQNDHNFANDWEFIETRAEYWMARASYEFSPALEAYANYGRSSGEEEYFYAASQMRRIVNSAGDFTARVGGFKGSYETRTYELGLRGQAALGSVSSRYALSYSDLDRTSRGATVHATGVYTGNIYRRAHLPVPVVRYGDIPRNGDLRLSSIGLANTLGFMDDTVLLTLGARHQKLYSGVFSAGVQTRAHEADKVTPTAALLAKLGRYSLYANYSEGLAQGAMAPNGTVNQGEFLPPSVTKQHEAGVKYDGEHFGVTAAVFQNTQPNTFTNSANRFVEDGQQRNRGVELSVFGEPAKGLRLLGGITLIDPRQTRTLNGINDGKQAVGVPRINMVINGEYDIAAVPGLTLTGRINAFSRAQADVGNTQSIPGWATLDLGARYATRVAGKGLTLHANLTNVADRSYWNSVSRGFITMGAPRTLLLSAVVDF